MLANTTARFSHTGYNHTGKKVLPKRCYLLSIFFFILGQTKNQTMRAQATALPTEMRKIPQRGSLSKPSTRKQNNAP